MMTERELSTEEAFIRLTGLYQQLGMHPKIIDPGNEFVSSCSMRDAQGNEISVGAGKGEQCKLGALAECLEHYFMELTAPETFTSEAILNAAKPYNDWLLSSIPLHCKIPSFPLQALDKRESILVPAILLAPSAKNADEIDKTAASFLARYASNTGTALGCTENEALLHALNEVIERHALSAYYLALCGLGPEPELYRPSKSFLRETFGHHRELLEQAEQMEIYLSHDFFDAPFCIAMPRNPARGTLSVVGSGCSIDPGIALYRAVTEQIQCTQLRGSSEKEEDRAVATMFANANRLQPLYHPRWPHKLPLLHPQREKLDVSAQLKCLLLKLNQQHKFAFARTLYHHADFATVVQVFICGLERFHLIRSGVPVVPQAVLRQGVNLQYGVV